MYRIRLVMMAGLIFGIMVSLLGCHNEDHHINGMSSRVFYEEYLHLLEDSNVVIIDGRTAEMFAGGHLKNAVNIDADGPDLSEKLKLYADQPMIVVYCTTNRRTSKIVQTLSDFYEGEILYIEDGIRGWKRNGFPVSGKFVSDN
ncbi:MAG: rhodanese-like domain-containing protein [Bacteroidales bacterium]